MSETLTEALKKGKPLTKQEHRIMRRLCMGESSQQVAEGLFVAKRTVDFHIANIYAKLGVNNRIKASLAYQKLQAGAGE